MTDTAIEVLGLTKRFGHVEALRGLDLRVPTGKVTGFLGPNGSGKSTTLRILLGLLRADGGKVSVLDRDPWTDAVNLHRSIAYVPGEVTLWPNLTGGEAIDILSGLSRPLEPDRRSLMIERFALDPTKRARAYSKGNRQKVALVAALASRAEVLILDEPTSGLDPLMEAAFTESIAEARAEGRSVLLSSHIFAEVERVADHVAIIRDGITVEMAPLADLHHLGRTNVSVELSDPTDSLAQLPGVHDYSRSGQRRNFSVDESAMPTVLAAIARLEPRSFVSNPPSLEEIFLRHYARSAEAAAGR